MKFRLQIRAGYVLVAAALMLAVPTGASAQGLLDFLFGRPPDRPSPPPPSFPQSTSRPSPPGSLGAGSSGPAPRNFDQPISNSNTGRSGTFCVRLCDGRYFPLERFSTITPAALCSTLCPASPTKVYQGGEIASAVGADGVRYAALKTAYLYRKSIVPNCTCNGRDIFGLAPVDVKSDPTLRAGDTVATADGVIVVTRPAEYRAAR